MTIQLSLFGPPRLTRNGVALPLNHRKAWALLAYLAVTAPNGHPAHSRDALATLLWPDYGQSAARGHLRRELARLRDLLGDDHFQADREQIALTATAPPGLVVDITAFQEAVTAAQACRHRTVTACPTCRPHLITAASAYRDHFLAGFTLPDSPAFDDWQFFQRDQLSAAQGWVLERLALPTVDPSPATSPPAPLRRGEGSQTAPSPNYSGEGVDPIDYARRWVAHDPLHEPAHRALMTLYAQAGQPTAALRQYESCVRLLDDELGAPPEAATVALYDAIRSRRTPDQGTRGQGEGVTRGQGKEMTSTGSVTPPPPHPLAPPPPHHALPTHTQPFIGRQNELAHYQRQVETRGLAVISGMPGVGKTALALALAQQIAERPAIFWHTCQPDEGVDGLLWRLAAFLAERGQPELWQMVQVPPQPGRALRPTPPLSALLDYLVQMVQQGDYLLCLDDFHHLEQESGAGELLQRLVALAQARRLRLLITARQPPSLPALAPGQPLPGLSLRDTRDLLRHHQLTLSADLLYQLHAETEGNGQFLTLILQALQQTTEPRALIEQLGAAEDLERHLLALVNKLLSPAEQAVMAAVAILEGYPGTRPALEAICTETRVRDALLSLAAHHLLTTERTPTGQRYATHTLVQKFFYNGLHRSERQTLHRRAAVYYATSAGDPLQAALHYLRADQMRDAAELITANLHHLIGQGRVRALHRVLLRLQPAPLPPLLWAAVCVARGQVWRLLGERTPARAAYDQAKALLATTTNAPILRAELLAGLADLAQQDSFAEALTLVQEGLAVLGDADPLLAASLHLKQAGFLAVQGEYAAGRQAAHRVLALLPPTPHLLQVAAHENLGVIDFHTGQMAQAAEHWTRGLAICRRLPHPFKALDLLNNLGAYHLVAGNWNEAGRLLAEGLAEAQKLGTAHHQAFFQLNLGILRTWQGEDAAAESHLLALSRQVGEYASNAKYSLADLRLRQGRLAEAASLLAEAATMITAAGATYQWPELHRLRAQLLLAQGDTGAALAAIEEALRLARELGMARDEGIALGLLGQLLAATDTTAADHAFQRSLELLADEPYERARTQMAWGVAVQRTGDETAARTRLEAAAQTFKHLGAQRDLHGADLHYMTGR